MTAAELLETLHPTVQARAAEEPWREYWIRDDLWVQDGLVVTIQEGMRGRRLYARDVRCHARHAPLLQADRYRMLRPDSNHRATWICEACGEGYTPYDLHTALRGTL